MRADANTASDARVFPHAGVCDRCLRDRTDLFAHPDGNRYCANVFACEARYEIQGRWEDEGNVTQAARRALCGFCRGEPVGDAASWVDGKPRPPAPCPRCGKVYARHVSGAEEGEGAG